MSFNTRSGRGRAVQQPTVTYHQTPPRVQQSPAVYNNQFQPQIGLQHPFSQAPVTPVQIPAPAQPSPPGVAPQQIQDQQTPQQLKMMKMETGTPPPASPGSASQAADRDGTETRPWKKLNKNPSFKVNKVQKRRRLNARFRKLLFPKNAIMVLNELHPGVVFDATESTNAFSQISYHVKIDIDGEKYTGEGSSKASAKSAAAELAVKGIILKKIAESAKKENTVEEESKEDITDVASGDDMSEKGSSVNGRRVIPEDEVPWGSLASFALFKLFAEWKTQGSIIPHVTPPLGKPALKNPAPKTYKPPVSAAAVAIAAGTAANATYNTAADGTVVAAAPFKAVVPDNAQTLHPVTLVGRLFPGTVFTEVARVGTPPNLTFTMGAVVNGTPYEGLGKSKKEAKKQCAIEVLKTVGVPYNPN